MTRPPLAALLLTAAGLIPFIFGVAASRGHSLGSGIENYEGRWIVYFYGAVILSFMGGALWGFAAAKNKGDDWGLMTLSVLPALWAFGTVLFAIYFEPASLRASFYLMAAGFALILVIDWYFQNANLAPRWWLSLRIPVSIVVLGCFLGTAADV
ncbi:MAG: DUF3429 domain-containing protein [Pseudomonadota bacterium]